jgi:hypothetical protein
MKTETLKVTEGVAGMWHYHLSEKTSKTRAKCGALVMGTSMPVSMWGTPNNPHLPPAKYCKECAKFLNQ